MPSSPLNVSSCPLCGQANQCAVAAGLPPASCWCMQTTIAPSTLAQLPTALQGQVCVCPACGQGVSAIQQQGTGQAQ